MSAEELKRLQRQQEANAIAIQRLQHQGRQQQQQSPEREIHEPPQQHQQYQQEDPNKIMLNAIINEAGNRAANQAADMMLRQTNQQNIVTQQMKDLIAKYPALQQDDSDLVVKAREIYPTVKQENPTLPEHVLYRMAVNEAATYLGARPVDAPMDFNGDFTMPSSRNPALPKKHGSTKRLTQGILENAALMGINVDASTPEGKKNREELAIYTDRFNADKDESEYRYK